MIQTRLIAMIVGALLLCSLAAGGGSVVATWKADAGHAGQVQELHDRIAKLVAEKHAIELAIAEQNEAVAVAEAQTLAANEAKATAEQHAADMAAFSKSRLDKLAQAFTNATSCEDVLKSYWELRK